MSLATFQRDGYERARRILQKHGGVVYADGVGTGKTEVGLAFIEEVALKGGRLALVICPAQLRRNWQERIDQARLPAQVLSFNELATDEQLSPDSPARRRHLHNDKNAYRLIVIDEAHALRNEETSWYRSMERLRAGQLHGVADGGGPDVALGGDHGADREAGSLDSEDLRRPDRASPDAWRAR